MKRLLLPILAFAIFFGFGAGGGAYLLKPTTAIDSSQVDTATASVSGVDPSHAPTSGVDSTASDIATASNDSAPPPRLGSAAIVTPHSGPPIAGGATGTPVGPNLGNSGVGSSKAAELSSGARTLDSLVRSQTGATVALRSDGSVGPPNDPSDSTPNYARLARLLSKMGPREAARTLEQLRGGEAARVLAAMTDKQAALVLQQLSPTLAAELLQATFVLPPKAGNP